MKGWFCLYPEGIKLKNEANGGVFPPSDNADESSASHSTADLAALILLDTKINALLPARYQHCYDSVKLVSMGSTELKFGHDGRVAWDKIWSSFCDLAIAGGPPHRGTLLEPGSKEEVLAEPEKYAAVVEEIARGFSMVTRLPILPTVDRGWIGVVCRTEEMAGWLVRAIVAENVSAHQDRDILYLPAGPHYRLTKEIKNVVTSLAKTCHYWNDHMPASQQAQVARQINTSEASRAAPLGPAFPYKARAQAEAYAAVVDQICQGVWRTTGLTSRQSDCLGWLGVACANEEMAVWMLRAVVVANILVRREAAVLYLPANPQWLVGEKWQEVVAALAHAWRCWRFQCARMQESRANRNQEEIE